MSNHNGAYCTKCRINWACLHNQDDEVGDESYEFCPKCHDDFFLVPQKPGATFLKCPISGAITNSVTGEAWVNPLHDLPNVKPADYIFNHEEHVAKDEARQRLEDKAIAHYHEADEREGREAAERVYFETFK